ncbi:MAG: twin-arginine translocase TatA/TatE family subunit [Planctomycetota bacterium]|nr:twin-arginine translocase TatA/TatE family subunit [Planctomycetota bacterium]
MPLAFLGMPSGAEWLIVLALGLLLFGSRLPEVGRSLGRSIVEFKKGIKGVEEEIESASSQPSTPRASEPARPAIASGDQRRVSVNDRVEEQIS